MKTQILFQKNYFPNIQQNKPEEEYHKDRTALNSSTLKYALHSMNSWLHEYNKDYAPPKSDAMEFGKLIHKIVLEGPDFIKRYVIEPIFEAPTLTGEMSTRSKLALQKKIDWRVEQESEGKIICSQSDFDRARWMIDSFLNHHSAFNLIKNGASETSAYAAHSETGMLMRARADFFSPSDSVLVDLKTCVNIEQRYFTDKRILSDDFRYDLQIAMYKDIYEKCSGKQINHVAWIVLENQKPFECAVYYAPQDLLIAADGYYNYAVNKIAKSIKSDTFAPYQTGAAPLILHEDHWYFKNLEFLTEL